MEWVTIKEYDLPYQVYFDRDLLEDHGIQTAIQDELLAQSNWFYTSVIGGVKLQVESENVEKSLALLSNREEQKLEVEHTLKKPKYKLKCPKCKSNNIYQDEHPSLFFVISYLLFGIPIPIKSGIYHCYYCENTWEN